MLGRLAGAFWVEKPVWDARRVKEAGKWTVLLFWRACGAILKSSGVENPKLKQRSEMTVVVPFSFGSFSLGISSSCLSHYVAGMVAGALAGVVAAHHAAGSETPSLCCRLLAALCS